jgi:hypothetical protein
MPETIGNYFTFTPDGDKCTITYSNYPKFSLKYDILCENNGTIVKIPILLVSLPPPSINFTSTADILTHNVTNEIIFKVKLSNDITIDN